MMQTRRLFTFALMTTLGFSAASYRGQAQELAKKEKDKTITPAASAQVTGSGTPDRYIASQQVFIPADPGSAVYLPGANPSRSRTAAAEDSPDICLMCHSGERMALLSTNNSWWLA